MALLKGEVDYYVSARHIHLKAGDCLFINSNTLHMGQQCSNIDAVTVGVTFQPSVLGAVNGNKLYTKYFESIIRSDIRALKIDIETETGNRIKEYIKEIEKIDIDTAMYELSCLPLLCSLWKDFLDYMRNRHALSYPITVSERHEDDAKTMISFIKKHYSENISVQDIATAVGISRTECFRSFKRFTSKTPVEYLLETRLSSAADMLIMGDDTVLEICMKCGFSGASYFGKRFKERYGITPMEFRNNR